MCCRKMDRRLKSGQSQAYIQALKQVKEFIFKPRPVDETSTNKSLRTLQREEIEFSNDRGLLEDFVLLASSKPGMLSIEIPNIILAAHNMPSEGHFELYTDSTHIEFHQLLLELLNRFCKALQNLSAASKQAQKGSQTIDTQTFKRDLSNGRVYGYALMRMARGRAFRMHMENIEPLLANYTRTTEASGSASAPNIEMDEQDIENKDEEIEAIGVDKMMGSLSKSYGAWLRLMVVLFDAIEILVNFVNGNRFPYESISVKILIANYKS